MGFDVAMTREDDRALYNVNDKSRTKKGQDLSERCIMKIDSGCDLFISIHLNMFQQQNSSGAQVWYSKESESKVVAHIIQENLKIKFLFKS